MRRYRYLLYPLVGFLVVGTIFSILAAPMGIALLFHASVHTATTVMLASWFVMVMVASLYFLGALIMESHTNDDVWE